MIKTYEITIDDEMKRGPKGGQNGSFWVSSKYVFKRVSLVIYRKPVNYGKKW